MRHLLVAAVLAAFYIVTGPTVSSAYEYNPSIWVQNDTDYTIEHIYVAPASARSYDETNDLLGNDVLEPGDGTWVYPDLNHGCRYWIEAISNEGDRFKGKSTVFACDSDGATFTIN